MATAAEAAQAYDSLKAQLKRSENKARVTIQTARAAQQEKDKIFADPDLKAKVKLIADARGESITGLGNGVKKASGAATALLPFYPDPVVEPAE